MDGRPECIWSNEIIRIHGDIVKNGKGSGIYMASLKDIAIEYKEEIMDGIAWVAIWKTGRSWNAYAFWLTFDTDQFESEEDFTIAKKIVAADEKAIFINEYYTAHMGDATINSIMDGIRSLYEKKCNLLKDSTAYCSMQ